MKHFLRLLFFTCFLQVNYVKAQWVTIPDANFVNWLTQQYPTCMNANQLDTTCLQILNEDTVIVTNLNLTSIYGIEFFDNLKYLKCNTNSLTSINRLPHTVRFLNCSSNQLNSLPNLPDSLRDLNCGANQLTSIPTLPNYLTSLDCNGNQLVSLPLLNPYLQILYCTSNQLTSIPTLPNSLTYLNCFNNDLISLPALPSNLQILYCGVNQIVSLPALPNSITSINCTQNQLSSLPTLPSGLGNLDCQQNQLTSLPSLPSSLMYLYCRQNQITVVPTLPNSLIHIDFSNNLIDSLPPLPNALTILWVSENQLTSLGNVPSTITNLACDNNLITSLPPLPIVMNEFLINNNNIQCLLNLPQVATMLNTYADISNNPLTCVPNQTWYSLGLPVCLENDPVNNPNNCYNVNITGYVYTDLNNNCTYEINDLGTNNILVQLLDSLNNVISQTFTFNGVYAFNSLQPNAYKVNINVGSFPILFSCGQSSIQNVFLDSVNQTISNINFSVGCEAGYDIDLQSVYTLGIAFPGQMHHLYTNILDNESWYQLACDSSISTGTVTIEINGPVTYVSPISGALTPQVNGNTFSYNINNFNNLNPGTFGLILLTDTTAQAGDPICVHVVINPTPLDADTLNNVYDFCYNVVNSYDPNMKEVYPVDVLPGYDDWFNYTIHFQNTGNAPAFNIRLRDTLDVNLDVNSFEILGYSHPAQVSLSGNILTVRFNNIMLPDSTSDYEGSMGYFQYRLKPIANLPNGTQIENTAYIYFDYNAPIITNTTQNNFDITVGQIEPVTNKNEFVLYPNPSNGLFNFKLDGYRDAKSIKHVEVYNLLGEQIIAQGSQKQINLSGFAKGIYYARINGEVVVKLVKD
jgi:uncharacterized repeat protein (TIGR01451 family)